MKLDVLLSVKGIQCLRKVSPFRHKIWDITKNFVPVKKSFHLNVKYEPLVLPTKDIDVFFELIEDEDKYLNLRQDNYNDEECDNEQS